MQRDEFVLDTDREGRLGFPEVIYGAGKSTELLRSILAEYDSVEKNALATRVEPEKAEILKKAFPNATYDERSRSFMLRYNELDEGAARVCIVSAGSSDSPVVDEAFYTLNFLGEPAARIRDVGVAGIHRLMNRLDDLKAFTILIVVAGFEGALPSVVAGLLAQPIIAVPTSTGYGAGAGGEAALRAMLSSCANGVSVVNIDNGYGAALAAFRILMALDTKQ